MISVKIESYIKKKFGIASRYINWPQVKTLAHWLFLFKYLLEIIRGDKPVPLSF